MSEAVWMMQQEKGCSNSSWGRLVMPRAGLFLSSAAKDISSPSSPPYVILMHLNTRIPLPVMLHSTSHAYFNLFVHHTPKLKFS